MAAEVDNNDAQPYTWEERPPPDPEVLQLWTEVGNGLEKNQTGGFIVAGLRGCFSVQSFCPS